MKHGFAFAALAVILAGCGADGEPILPQPHALSATPAYTVGKQVGENIPLPIPVEAAPA